MRISRATAIQACLLGLISLASHALQGWMSLLEYPTQDMWAFFLRATDPSFAPGDFYTDCSSAPSPRLVFGRLVLGLAGLTGQGWMQALFLLKSLLVACLPPLYFLVLLESGRRAGLWEREAPAARRWLFLLVLGFSQLHKLNMYAAVGLWAPFYTIAHPQALSLLFGLSGLLLLADSPLKATACLAAASFLHPALGLFQILFAWAVEGRVSRGWLGWAGVLAAGWLLPAGILAKAFGEPGALAPGEFVDIYTYFFHPFHYLPTRLMTNTRFPAWIHIAAALLALLLPGWLAGPGRAALKKASWRCAAAYGLVILVSWLGLEVWRSKTVAALGPMRFTQFGAWMGAALWAGLLANPAAKAPRSLLPLWRPALILFLAALGAALALFKDPIRQEQARRPGLYAWMATTPKDAVFASTPFTRLGGLVAGRRAQLLSDGFPFRESCFREFRDRAAALYGSEAEARRYEESSPDFSTRPADYNTYYELYDLRRGPAEFLAMAGRWKLDYVIRNRARPGAGFARYTPVYEDGEVLVYAIADLRRS